MFHGTDKPISENETGVAVAALTNLVFVSYIRTGDVISEEITRKLDTAEPETIPISD